MARTSEQGPAKQAKLDAGQPTANIIVQFQNDAGETVGPQLDLPHAVTPANLENLLNGLLQHSERTPYSFYVNDLVLSEDLGSHLRKHAVSVEAVLKVVYQAQAVFRVRPVARCSASISGHSESILAIAFSPDGTHLSSGSGDSTVRLWDLPTQTPKHTCKGHRNWVLCLSWSPDAVMLASGGMDGNIYLWDPATGEARGSCKDCIQPGSPCLHSSLQGFIQEPLQLLSVLEGHTKWVTTLAWEPAHLALPSQRLCSGSKDASIKVWDASSRRCLFSMSSHTKAISTLKWSGEGNIISAARDCSINVWSSEDGQLLRTLKGHGHWVNTLALSSEYVLRTGAFDHTGTCPPDLHEAKAAALQRYAAATAGRAERLASGSDDYTMFLWEPSTSQKPLQRMTGHLQLINQVAFSPDGRFLASASFDKSIKLWDGVKGTFISTFRGHVGPVYQISWSSDSRLLVSGSKDSTMKVWDASSRSLKVDLPGHADEVFAVDWSPTGAFVASGGKDLSLRLWRQ